MRASLFGWWGKRCDKTKIAPLLQQMKRGDYVVATFGDHKLAGYGRLTCDFSESRPPSAHDEDDFAWPDCRQFTCEWTALPFAKGQHKYWNGKHLGVTTGLNHFPCIREIDKDSFDAIRTALDEAGAMRFPAVGAAESPASPNNGLDGPAPWDEELDAYEGERRQYFVTHRKREAKLRQAKIDQVLQKAGRLRCEVPGCGLDFAETYGEELGGGFAHVHHLKPLASKQGLSKTRLADLAIVCPNCHAMIHRFGECRRLKGLIKK